MTSSSGLTVRHTVFHVVPSCRASPRTEACSRRSCRAAHHAARVVSNPRGRATRSSCSVNTATGHVDSGQHQVRFHHTTVTGRPKHGASISSTSRPPWLKATTPQVGHPTSPSGDSTRTRRYSSPVTTSRT